LPAVRREQPLKRRDGVEGRLERGGRRIHSRLKGDVEEAKRCCACGEENIRKTIGKWE